MGLAERPARPPLHRGQKDCFGGTPKVRAGLALTFETRALLGTQTSKSVFLSIFRFGVVRGRCGEQLTHLFVAGLGKIFVVLADAHE